MLSLLLMPVPLPPTWTSDISRPAFVGEAAPASASDLRDLGITVTAPVATTASFLHSNIGTALRVVGTSGRLIDSAVFDPRLLGQLFSYFEIRDNWDGEGASAPTHDAVDDALQFAEMIPVEVGMPKAMILPTGDLAFYWDRGPIYVEIGFDGSGQFYAYGTHPNHEPVYMDDQTIDGERGIKNFPEKLREILIDSDLALAA
jgi:hypothetical protein